MSTIFARSTAPGRAGIAVVRISGPASWDLVRGLTDRPLPPPRMLVRRNILCDGELVEIGMVVLFEERRSFTGEQSAELHLHGSEAVVRRVLRELGNAEGARLADAGEFTQRAFLNNKMDLSSIEGLSALLVAETEAQRRQAMRILTGTLREKAGAWRAELVGVLAEIEAVVDFADEEVPDTVSPELGARIARTASAMRSEGQGVADAEKIARGFEVAIVGRPNAGKSTLLNRLAGRDAALTSEIAGTTRDVIEVRMEIAGQLVTLLDTAGIRATEAVVERAGVALALRRAQVADLRICLGAVPEGLKLFEGDLVLREKADLDVSAKGFGVSGLTGQGVDRLLVAIGERLNDRVAGAGIAVTERQAQALLAGAEALEDVRNMLEAGPGQLEIVSALLWRAIQATDQIVGRIGVEDVLGEIFSQFCIGK
ncbi:MAG: tRNA uridine-5-carboxymethylaminomethyl(34) synthesis GTPase MnmE [Pseudomonadota bacterium]